MSLTTSIIITVYNRAHLLKRAFISLLNQSMLPDELIISDDGSSEDIVSTIEEFKNDFSFPVIYTRQEDKGFRLARTRNNGIRASSGDYIIFLDQDLIYTENFIETLIRSRRINHFCTTYPVRLSKEQSENVLMEMIEKNDYDAIITRKQREKIRKQYRKDKFYYYVKKLGIRKRGPKLRGGACGINRADLIKVNGYDEQYVGWGYEDDDVARRLYTSDTLGINVARDEFPIHLYHEPFHENGKRINRPYHLKNKFEIQQQGRFRAHIGLENPQDPDEVITKQIL